MRKPSHLLFLSAALLLLVGAGCGTTTSQAPKPPQQITTPDNTQEQKAYVFCSDKGFTPKVRFDGEVNRNRLFCVFEEGRECDAIEFMENTCNQTTVAQKLAEDDPTQSLTPLGARFNCEAKAVPVCGTDGKTYTNRCIAESQGKTVKYDGVCNEKDEPLVVQTPPSTQPTKTSSQPSKTSSSRSSNSNTSRPVTSQVEATAPDWVTTLTSLLADSSSPYPITLSECKESKKIYYYQKEDCSDCFRALYNDTGEILCYPGYGENGACPNFDENNCKVIWKK